VLLCLSPGIQSWAQPSAPGWAELLTALKSGDTNHILGLARKYHGNANDRTLGIFADDVAAIIELAQTQPRSSGSEELPAARQAKRLQLEQVVKDNESSSISAKAELDQAEEALARTKRLRPPGSAAVDFALRLRDGAKSKFESVQNGLKQRQAELARLNLETSVTAGVGPDPLEGARNRLTSEVTARIAQLGADGNAGAAQALGDFYARLFGQNTDVTRALGRLKPVSPVPPPDLGTNEAKELLAKGRPWAATNALTRAERQLAAAASRDPEFRLQASKEIAGIRRQAGDLIQKFMKELGAIMGRAADDPQKMAAFDEFVKAHPDYPDAARDRARVELEEYQAKLDAIQRLVGSQPLGAYQRLLGLSPDLDRLQLDTLRARMAAMSNGILDAAAASLGERLQAARTAQEKDAVLLEARSWTNEPMNEVARAQFSKLLAGAASNPTEQHEASTPREVVKPVVKGRGIGPIAGVAILGIAFLAVAAWYWRGSAGRNKGPSEGDSITESPPEVKLVRYPSARQYARAVMTPKTSFIDPELQAAAPETMAGNPSEPLVYSGQFARVYKLRTSSGCFAFKCWTHSIGDAADLYGHISRCLAGVSEPYFIGFRYQAEAIVIEGVKHAGIKMDWVEGETLRRYVGLNLARPRALLEVGQAFERLVKSLHGHKIAHADLQGENIMVTGVNGHSALKLIDYDTMVVPTLCGRPASNAGHSDFQHPKRLAAKGYRMSTRDDYFSELVIHTALMSLAYSASARSWYQTKLSTGRGFDPLLFAETDFANPDGSAIFSLLRADPEPYVVALTEALANACKSDMESLERLEVVLAGIVAAPSEAAERSDSPR